MTGEEKRLPRLLLIGAGETEIGRPSRNPSDQTLRGAVLPYLLDKLLPVPRAFLLSVERQYEIAETLKFDQIPYIPNRKLKSTMPLDADKLRRALFLANERNLAGVVVLIDREKTSQPDRAARLQNGRAEYRKRTGANHPACAVGAACRCIETWLLADPEARQDVFGDEATDPFSGVSEERPAPRALKQYIAEWAAKRKITRYEAQERLAEEARPSILKTRCPTSYLPFAEDVKTEICPLIRPS